MGFSCSDYLHTTGSARDWLLKFVQPRVGVPFIVSEDPA